VLLTSPLDAACGVDPGLPHCPAGWRLDVMLRSPQLRHPSVVCCAPDGRVFVAEDPMDISAPRADLKQGRILCLHPDGRVTTFADGLHAVFGMQYLDGKLFVLHNPRFSVFADGGDSGRDEVLLIECTNPNPWALDWNDHVPANFRLAMDGYLYVAVGDKGVYGAVGRDGRRVDLHGGGILRLRPDGTGLEIYCTGVRNILDVALDEEDELFTYDNTDEHHWMSRLTHMVDGGDYGYPYDFAPRRPYTLWMMADYGGGAATGALCYTEDALPAEYRGNLFLADFGKRQILRVAVSRDGATFQVASKAEMFAEPPSDFRPVGIAVAPDGLGFYICDWQHADTKEAVAVCRLLRLTYTGGSLAEPTESIRFNRTTTSTGSGCRRAG
jgi:putative membrane-bound dehydrogenase-like protein